MNPAQLDSRSATTAAPRRRGKRPAPQARPLSQYQRARLTPVQFKAALYAKGWQLKDIAEYWGGTREWVTRVAKDPTRPIYFDHAVRGLPRRGRPIPLPPSWIKALKDGQADAVRQAPAVRPAAPGFEYQGYLLVGTILVVSKYLGEEIDEGMRGIVVGVDKAPDGERYAVVFESGVVEHFRSKDVEAYLAETGLDQAGLQAYRYTSDDQVRDDFDRGLFEF